VVKLCSHIKAGRRVYREDVLRRNFFQVEADQCMARDEEVAHAVQYEILNSMGNDI
jgi:hypothetical protein